MTNREVFEQFAVGQPADGGNVRSVRHGTKTVVLYSYGTPVAFRVDGGEGVRFDARSHSPTTSKQVTQAKRACLGQEVTDLRHELFRKAVDILGADLAGAR